MSSTFQVTYIINQKTYEVEVEKGRTLLEGAIMAQINPPYSCLEGVCSSCEARIEKGEVVFSDGEEVKPNSRRVKTCQSLPKSSPVVVNYDLK